MECVYLAHHGILGQKWGVRRYQNPDGTWTEAGKARYGKALQNASYDMLKSDKYKKAVSDLDKAYKEVDDYYNLSEKQRDKYIRKASDNAYDEYVKRGDKKLDELADLDVPTKEDFFNAYKYDDFDQGSNNSFSYYLKDKGIDPKDWTKREWDANKKFASEVKSAVDDSLKKLGPEEYSAIRADTKQYERIVDQIVSETKVGERGWRGYWYNLLET